MFIYYGFNPCFNGFCSECGWVVHYSDKLVDVSILVLMDFVRNVCTTRMSRRTFVCFNPCFNGFCSECLSGFDIALAPASVSILVLMDFVRNEGQPLAADCSLYHVSILVLMDFVRNAGQAVRRTARPIAFQSLF